MKAKPLDNLAALLDKERVMKFLSQLVTSVSGSIGGIVGSHNRFGMYFRAKGMPINPNTERQQEVRSTFGQASVAWSTVLTNVQRQSWIEYAQATPIDTALGVNSTLTGFQQFLATNGFALDAGLPLITTAPAVPGQSTLTIEPATLAITVDTPDITITADGAGAWGANDGGRLYVGLGNPVTAGRSFYNGPFQSIGYVSGNTMTPIVDVAAPAAVGHVSVGQHYFVRFRGMAADGRLTFPIIAGPVVTEAI